MTLYPDLEFRSELVQAFIEWINSLDQLNLLAIGRERHFWLFGYEKFETRVVPDLINTDAFMYACDSDGVVGAIEIHYAQIGNDSSQVNVIKAVPSGQSRRVIADRTDNVAFAGHTNPFAVFGYEKGIGMADRIAGKSPHSKHLDSRSIVIIPNH